jgi:hypothetical protein
MVLNCTDFTYTVSMLMPQYKPNSTFFQPQNMTLKYNVS